MRSLNGEEKWRVTELSPSKEILLDELGLSQEKGQLAGNSITGRMTTTVVEVVSKRVADYQRVKEAVSTKNFPLYQPSFELRSKKWSSTIRICISMAAQLVMVWSDDCTPCAVSRVVQSSAFKMACSWIDQLRLEDASSKCILLGRSTDGSVSRAVVYYGMDLKAAAGAKLKKIDSVMGTPLGVRAVAALAQVVRLRKEVTINSTLEGHGWTSGSMGGTTAHQVESSGIVSTAKEDAFAALVVEHNISAHRLKQLLKNSDIDAVKEWAQNIDPLQIDEVPGALGKSLGDLEWSLLELPDPHAAITTQ